MKSKVLPYAPSYPASPPSVAPSTAGKGQEAMVLRYTPFVKYIAHRLAMRLPPHILVEDLISAGVIGLMDALAKFAPEKKVEFKTYAEFRIRGAMLDELRSLDLVPKSIRQKASQIEKSVLHLEKTKGRSVEDGEIATHLGMSLEEYYQMVQEINGNPLLDQELLQRKIGKLSDEEIINLLLDIEMNDPFHLLNLKELKRVLAEAIQTLSEKEKRVIALYYQEELTLKGIGKVLDLTESRICQIHTKAILELRRKLRRFIQEESYLS